MADVTLYAQPREKKPLVSIAALDRGEYVVRRKGTLGVIWFTDLGAAVWETCLRTDGEARIKLADRGFDELDWTVYFKTGGYQVRLEAVRYKGKYGKVTNTYCLLKVRKGTSKSIDSPEHKDEKAHIRTFVKRLHEILGYYPFGFKYPGELENTTDKTPDMIREDWESILGHKIDRPEPPAKKRRRKAEKKDDEEKPEKPAKERKFGFAAGLMAKAGIGDAEDEDKPDDEGDEVQVLECPECSADVPLPTEGNLIKCPDCGLEGEAPERLEPVVFECPGCDGDIEIWTHAMPNTLECPHCGVSGSLGEETDEAGEEEAPEADEKKTDEKEAGTDEQPGKVALKSADDRGEAAETETSKTEPLVRPGKPGAKPEAEPKPAAKAKPKPKPKAKPKPKPKPKPKKASKPREVKPPTGPKGKELKKHGKLEGLWIYDKYYLISPSGVKYDRELLQKAQSLVDSRSTKQITVDDCEELYEKVADASKYTDCEKRTMKYIRDNCKFTPAGDKKFRHMIASWAAKKAAKTRKANAEKK